MQSVFTIPRPLEDPFVAKSSEVIARKPLVFHTPTFGYASHHDKARAATIFSSSLPTPLIAPNPVPSVTSSYNSVGTKARFATDYSQAAPVPTTPFSPTHPATMYRDQTRIPSTPNTPALSRSGDSSDVEMCSVATPPLMSRGLNPSSSGQSIMMMSSPSSRHSPGNRDELKASSSHLARSSITRPLPYKKPVNSARLPTAIQTDRLQFPTAPLTPPLTPPSQASIHELLPCPDLASPILLPAQTPAQLKSIPTTVSARKLAQHALHPLFASQYSIQEELGSGGFGFVVRAERNEDGLSVAVKFIERNKIPSHGWVTSRYWGEAPGLSPPTEGYRNVPLEAFVLRSVRHDGVVAFIDLFEDETYFYLVMEHHGSPWQGPSKKTTAVTVPAPISGLPVTPLASPTLENGPPSPKKLAPPRPAPMERRASCDLFECIEQYTSFDEATAKYIFAQIVDVVASLGRIGVCHRDIKDENIVVSSDFRVKLIDFGSAVIFDAKKPAPFYARFHGTHSFASSEILRGQPYQPPQSEVWSLGVLLSILVTGKCPFSDAEAAKAGRISRPKVPLGRCVDNLMRGCLEVDTARRLTIDEVLNHPWLRDADQLYSAIP